MDGRDRSRDLRLSGAPLPVVVDADVLYGATTRALLVYLDLHDLIRMHWSPLLLDEASRALIKTGRKTVDATRRNAESMHRVVPGAAVPTLAVQARFRTAWPGVRDAKDLHVAACAVALLADGWYPAARDVHLITRNTKDFAPKPLRALGVIQQHPDAFLLTLWERDPAGVAAAFERFRTDMPSAPQVSQLLDKLANDGQRRTAAALGRAYATSSHVL